MTQVAQDTESTAFLFRVMFDALIWTFTVLCERVMSDAYQGHLVMSSAAFIPYKRSTISCTDAGPIHLYVFEN